MNLTIDLSDDKEYCLSYIKPIDNPPEGLAGDQLNREKEVYQLIKDLKEEGNPQKGEAK